MTLLRYSLEEVREELKKVAEELCRRLAPIAVEVEVHDALRKVRVFMKCTDIK